MTKDKDWPLTLLCALILELSSPCAFVPDLGTSILCSLGPSIRRASHGAFVMNSFCARVVTLVLQGGAGREQPCCVCAVACQGAEGSPCPAEPPLALNETKGSLLTRVRDQAEAKSQTQPPKYTLDTVPSSWVWKRCGITPSWRLGIEAQMHWMTWSDTRNLQRT